MRALPAVQKEDHAEKRRSIEQERDAGTRRRDHQSAKRRAEGTGNVESDGIQRHRRSVIFRANDLRRDGLPGRIVHDRAQSKNESNSKSIQGHDVLQSVSRPSSAGSQNHPALGDEQKTPPVDYVSQCARGQDHQKYRQGRGGRTRLTINGDMVSCVISHPAPTFCIHVPV